MKIAILYICTGKYHIFWKSFYESAEKFLLPNHIKNYFVFTDANFIDYQENNRINIIFQKRLGWPYDTLMRFDMFLKVEQQLLSHDFIFFLNANMPFLDYVTDDILPDARESYLMGVQHPFFTWVENPKDFPYERRKKSLAYIPPKKGNIYYMGGFNGGACNEYLQLIRTLNKNIHTDLNKNIIAKWHDESHLNKYFLDKNIKTLPPTYGCPEGMENEHPNPKIIILDKSKFGGHDYLRETNNSIPVEQKKQTTIFQKVYNLLR